MGKVIFVFLVYCVGGWVVRAMASSVGGGKESAKYFAMGFYDVLCGGFIYGASQASLDAYYLTKEDEMVFQMGLAFSVVIFICGALYLYKGYKTRQQEEEEKRMTDADKELFTKGSQPSTPYIRSDYVPTWKKIERGEKVENIGLETEAQKFCQYCGKLVSAEDANFCKYCGKEL